MRRILEVKEADAIMSVIAEAEVKCDCCNEVVFDGDDLDLWRWVQDGLLSKWHEKCHLICKECLINEYDFDSRNFPEVDVFCEVLE